MFLQDNGYISVTSGSPCHDVPTNAGLIMSAYIYCRMQMQFKHYVNIKDKIMQHMILYKMLQRALNVGLTKK